MRELKRAVSYMIRISTLGIHGDLHPGAAAAIERTVSLSRAYIRLCELELAMNKTESEAREDERLDARELLDALEDRPDEGGDPDPL